MPLLALSLALLLGLQATAAQSGAAGVTGRVLDAETKQPIAGAQVSLILEGRPPTGPIAPTMAETDASGIYRFANLAPGRYRIMARRVGYAVSAPPDVPQIVQVAAGQAQTAPDVLLGRGGVIAGRVLDQAGQPLVDARLMATRRMNVGRGQAPSLIPIGNGAQTNDLGEFRLHSLPAGEYFVQLIPRMEPNFMGAGPTPRSTAPATTYYPGTADAASAHGITLGAGQTVEGVVFNEVVVPVFQVSGIVIDETGAPVPEAMVMLMPDAASANRSFGPPARARADREGRFRLVNVVNGAYVVNASVPIVAVQGGGGGVGATSSTWSSSSASGGASGGISSATMVETRNCVTTSYRSDNASQVKVAVQDGHVTDLRVVVRR